MNKLRIYFSSINLTLEQLLWYWERFKLFNSPSILPHLSKHPCSVISQALVCRNKEVGIKSVEKEGGPRSIVGATVGGQEPSFSFPTMSSHIPTMPSH